MKFGLFILQINIKLKSEMPVQIDGEPWMQGPGNVIVRPILTQVRLQFCMASVYSACHLELFSVLHIRVIVPLLRGQFFISL